MPKDYAQALTWLRNRAPIKRMLKPRNIPDIFLGALLACAIFALGFSVALSFYPPQENRSAQKTEKKGNGSITDDRLADYTLALDWLNFFLVLSTVGLWLATKRNAKIAESALTELEAPFVFVQINNAGLKVEGGGVTWGNLQWCVVNYGRTPASILEIFVAEEKLIPFGEEPKPVKPAEHRGDRLPYGVIAPPNGGQSHDFPVVPVNAALQQSGPPGKPFSTHSPFFLGFVRYTDIFQNRFILDFCFIFDARSNARIRALGDDYNYYRKEA